MIDRRPARADLGPTTRAYVKAMGWRSVNFHTHISLVNKYVYVEVPKAGCGTMKATLGALEGARLNETHAQRFLDKPHNGVKSGAHVRPYQLPSDLLEEVFTSKDYNRFTVVRNPASRVLSGYLEKITQGLRQSVDISEAVNKPAAEITFAEFLTVIKDQDSRDQDPHWRRQADHIGLGIIDYSDVIHLEDLDDSWPTIAQLTRTPDLDGQFYCKTSTKAASKVDQYRTVETDALVREIYARDFTELGY
ncbi:MAG: sulfotransferase family protein [Candidatus Nanopelagicales bacterium]|nr:sulfotransferase family protein [Candidatus Nanopelagicales bacterium]MCF8538898.1 sulfotransferase family protein [Candidatus Nanopelagicales bacterium]MCF8551367.1 sulfotransferase family protein [Candidatus Nanopelagicales bacterium]